MDLSNHLLNALFIIGIFVVFAIGVSVLIKAAASNNPTMTVLAGAFVFALVVGVALFWSDGSIRTTMSEKLKSFFVSSTAVATAIMPPVSSPVNIRVEVPEQAPPTVIIQNGTSSSGGSASAEPTSEESDADATAPSQAGIFDLGSQIDGYFSDGVPYDSYTVVSGDTIYGIRTRNSVSEAEFLRRNPQLDIRRPIIIGEEVKIPQIPPE